MRLCLPVLLVLLPLPAQAAEIALSRNADLLVPGHGSALMYPPGASPAVRAGLGGQPGIGLPLMEGNNEVAVVHISPGMRVAAADLAPWVADNMNEEAAQSFKTLAARGALEPGKTQEAGFDLSYDAEQAVLRIKADPRRSKPQNISFGNDGAPGMGTEILAPAPVSGFVNLRAGEIFTSGGQGDGRQPVRVDSDGAVNIRNWVLEARGDYQEGDARPFARDDTRLVHDWPGAMVRAQAGDLSYPVAGFQSFQPLFGFGIARRFDLQPYRVTQPAGQDSFTVLSGSRADVVVNGQKVRTLRLDPGTYNLSDFPVTEGSNDVKLVITDDTGRVEARDLSLISDQELLKQGLHSYAYNLGFESETEDREIRYHLGRPAATFFHSYGFTDTLTAGIAGQADEDVAQGGLTAVIATAPGAFGINAFSSVLDGAGGAAAADITFRRRTPETRRDFSMLLRYESPRFAGLGQPVPLNMAGETAVRYSQPVLTDINMSLGADYRFARGAEEDDWSFGAGFSKVLSSTVTVTLNGDVRRMDGAGAFVNLTWSPPASRGSYAATVDTLAKTENAEWRYRSARALRSWQADAGVTHREEGGELLTGGAAYQDYRFETALRHDITTGADDEPSGQRSQASFGTALAFAGARAAVTRPVTGSFILLAPHESLKGRAVGVNPETSSSEQTGGFQAEIDGFGPGVLPDATPYMYRPVKIDTRALPMGYDIGRDVYSALPSYKSGTLIVVGSAANVFADGYLKLADGTPAGLQGGVLKNMDDREFPPQEFFTNAEGRFRIGHLEPGAYTASLYQYPSASFRIVIPPKPGVGRFDAGAITLQEAPK